ncbi:unnamed protein product, partial [Prorocentrum cordatum]
SDTPSCSGCPRQSCRHAPSHFPPGPAADPRPGRRLRGLHGGHRRRRALRAARRRGGPGVAGGAAGHGARGVQGAARGPLQEDPVHVGGGPARVREADREGAPRSARRLAADAAGLHRPEGARQLGVVEV